MSFRVQVSPGANANITKVLRNGATITVRREAARVAEAAVKNAEQLAGQDLYIDRPASRRRSGSRKYSTGFKARVVGSEFPFKVELSNASKVAKLLENGSPAHKIPKGNKAVGLPEPWSPKGSHDGVQHSDAYGAAKTWARNVDHPGTQPYKIMERALKKAFRDRGARLTK